MINPYLVLKIDLHVYVTHIVSSFLSLLDLLHF